MTNLAWNPSLHRDITLTVFIIEERHQRKKIHQIFQVIFEYIHTLVRNTVRSNGFITI